MHIVIERNQVALPLQAAAGGDNLFVGPDSLQNLGDDRISRKKTGNPLDEKLMREIDKREFSADEAVQSDPEEAVRDDLNRRRIAIQGIKRHARTRIPVEKLIADNATM
ncbi:MAG: hypothetical protein IANPNBLG_02567 [Bryobacteraceae bacterium]|nr:hypothetical protein [Bryobacteraceae bacterium]